MGANQSDIQLSFKNPYSKDMVNIYTKTHKRGRPAETGGPPGANSPAMEPPADTPPIIAKIPEEYEKNEKYWEERLNRLEESHKRLRAIMMEANADAQVELEKILPKVPDKDSQPPCKAVFEQIAKCYQSNSKEPLNCAKQVKAYQGCLGEAMGVVINAKDIEPIPEKSQKVLIMDELKKIDEANAKKKRDSKPKQNKP